MWSSYGNYPRLLCNQGEASVKTHCGGKLCGVDFTNLPENNESLAWPGGSQILNFMG